MSKRYRIKKWARKVNYADQYIIEYMPQRQVKFLWFYRWKNLTGSSMSFQKAVAVIDAEMNHGFGDEDELYYEKPNNKVIGESK